VNTVQGNILAREVGIPYGGQRLTHHIASPATVSIRSAAVNRTRTGSRSLVVNFIICLAASSRRKPRDHS
jgi:hypothetical protein